MLTKESIYVILYSLPVYQLLFYTVQLVSFKRKNPSKKYLGLLLLSMTGFLVINATNFLGYKVVFSHLYFFYVPVLLSVAPTYFLYILSITRENHDVKKRQRLILFSPAIIFLVSARWRIVTASILSEWEQGGVSIAAAYSTVIIVFVLLAIGLLYWLTNRLVRGRGDIDINIGV